MNKLNRFAWGAAVFVIGASFLYCTMRGKFGPWENPPPASGLAATNNSVVVVIAAVSAVAAMVGLWLIFDAIIKPVLERFSRRN